MRTTTLALRCNVARALTGLSFRDFAIRAAESSLLQWFLRIQEVDRVKVPAKSALERFSKWVGEETMAPVHLKLLAQAVAPAHTDAPQPLSLTQPVDPSEVFFDSTCLKATHHRLAPPLPSGAEKGVKLCPLHLGQPEGSRPRRTRGWRRAISDGISDGVMSRIANVSARAKPTGPGTKNWEQKRG